MGVSDDEPESCNVGKRRRSEFNSEDSSPASKDSIALLLCMPLNEFGRAGVDELVCKGRLGLVFATQNKSKGDGC